MPTKTLPDFTGPEVCRMEAHEVVDLLKAKEISPNDLLDAAFTRLEMVESAINATPTTCRDRAEHAIKSLPRENSGHAGWLAGLPITIKDLTPVKGVRTTYGTKGLANNIPDASDPLVERLEDRGGVIIGKTNTPELGAGANTFNQVFGRTRNPWDTRMNPAGSSGGAAASLATGEVWLSHGSDHGGSLRTPAAYCGIVGLRPTPGRAGGAGAQAGYFLESVQGPMARSVEDCALFLDAMAGYEPRFPISYPAPNRPFQEAVLRATNKVRVAFSMDLQGFCTVEPDVEAHIRIALGAIARNGATIVEDCPDLTGLAPTYYTLRGLSWATELKFMPENITRHLKQTIVENAAFGRNLTVDDFANANVTRTTIYGNMRRFLNDFDVLACPTVGVMPKRAETEWVDQINGQKMDTYMDWLRFSFLATVAGLPAISVPVGIGPGGMPVGLQLIGPPRGEDRVLAAARAVEMAMGGAMTPIDPVVRH